MFRTVQPLRSRSSHVMRRFLLQKNEMTAANTNTPFIANSVQLSIPSSSTSNTTSFHHQSFSTRQQSSSSSSNDDDEHPLRVKFVSILNEFKAANFEKDTPKRFYGMMLRASDPNNDGIITMKEFRTMLKNIGAEDKMTDEECDQLFDLIGEELEEGEVVEGVAKGEKVIRVESEMERWGDQIR
eukprot:CAMPEP_0183727366 /NCGR_PEP_ID=MMETSP0737-20130205/25536_1 /TAXON_ID=385413 /ORGANISM="Thalassiosira miniscula, Strain CCMP1093" /LENGTH=183 /DNA_ID=CAMNT_0025958981 /DNA_START=173 /DNA_END=724 /DNA_ORIENTATION=+